MLDNSAVSIVNLLNNRIKRTAQKQLSDIEAKLLHDHEFAIGSEASRGWYNICI
jgi:hypothetical protein